MHLPALLQGELSHEDYTEESIQLLVTTVEWQSQNIN